MIRLFRPPQWIAWFYRSCTWRLAVSDKTVFLTFDDGPHPDITPFVLEELARRKMTATFFCVGENVVRYPEIVEQILAGGHTIGNHTMRHTNGRKVSNAVYFESVADFDRVFPTPLFRPPYGRLRLSQLRELRKQYRVILWSWLSYDFDATVPIERILEKSASIRPGDIVVLHDNPKITERIHVLLPQLLDRLEKKGYTSSAITVSLSDA